MLEKMNERKKERKKERQKERKKIVDRNQIKKVLLQRE